MNVDLVYNCFMFIAHSFLAKLTQIQIVRVLI